MLKEPGRSSASKSYMWLYRTSGCAEQAIVLYEYQSTRKTEHAENFLKGFSGWLHTDGYQGYHKLFANTPGGAQASSVIYSLIETAKENGLDPYRYLLWLLQNAPGLSETDEAWAEKLLPANAPKECYMTHK